MKPAGLVGGTSAWTLPSSSSSEMVSPQSTHVHVYTCVHMCVLCVYVGCTHACACVCVVCVCRVHTCMRVCMGCVCEWEAGGTRK